MTRRAERTRRDGELASAGDRRAAQHLFNLTSSAASAKEIRIYGLRTELLGRHRHLSEEVHRRIESALFRSVLVNAGGWFLFAAAYVAAVIVVLAQAAHGRVTAGDVALTLTLATSLVAAAGRLSELAGSGLRAVTASEHYHWLDGQAERAAPGRPPPDRLDRGIDLDRVTFAYAHAQHPALAEVSLHLPAGAVVAIVGENGAGKTTLVKLLSAMYQPTEGSVLVDGQDLASIDPVAYRHRVTAGFQDFTCF